MEKKCKNCKYWNKYNYNDWELDFHKDASYRGLCHNPKFVYTGNGDDIDIDGFGYSDMEDYNADFYTGEDFGCIHFEPRNT